MVRYSTATYLILFDWEQPPHLFKNPLEIHSEWPAGTDQAVIFAAIQRILRPYPEFTAFLRRSYDPQTFERDMRAMAEIPCGERAANFEFITSVEDVLQLLDGCVERV